MRKLNRKRYNGKPKPKKQKEKVKLNKDFNNDNAFEADRLNIILKDLRYGNITHGKPLFISASGKSTGVESWEKLVVLLLWILYKSKSSNKEFIDILANNDVLSNNFTVALENFSDLSDIRYKYEFDIPDTQMKLYISDINGEVLYKPIISLSKVLGLELEEDFICIERKTLDKGNDITVRMGDKIIVEAIEDDALAYLLCMALCKLVDKQTIINCSTDGVRIGTEPEENCIELKNECLFLWYSGNKEHLEQFIKNINPYLKEEMQIHYNKEQ